jgi:hypothetical protein
MNARRATSLLHCFCLFVLLFHRECEGITFLRNVAELLAQNKAPDDSLLLLMMV